MQREVDDLAAFTDYWRPGTLYSHKLLGDSVGYIISEVGLPLVGWQQPVPDCWPNFVDPDQPGHYLTSRGIVLRKGEDANGNSVFLVRSYQLENGRLVRRWSYDKISEAYVGEPCIVRRPSDTSKVTADDAVGILAALMRAFEPYRTSLQDRSIFRAKHGRDVDAAGRKFLRLLRAPESEAFGISCMRAEDAVQRFLADLNLALADVEQRSKPKAARRALMGPMQEAFRLLFGLPATSRFVFEGDGAVQRADGPFIRFAEAVFAAFNCKCKPNTVNSELQEWRKEQRLAVRLPDGTTVGSS
jgi:hypothetical protein